MDVHVLERWRFEALKVYPCALRVDRSVRRNGRFRAVVSALTRNTSYLRNCDSVFPL